MRSTFLNNDVLWSDLFENRTGGRPPSIGDDRRIRDKLDPVVGGRGETGMFCAGEEMPVSGLTGSVAAG
jgi:hypothetical protein